MRDKAGTPPSQRHGLAVVNSHIPHKTAYMMDSGGQKYGRASISLGQLDQTCERNTSW
jgi:hypothetical protein